MNLFVLRQEEITAILNAEHSNPHHILGMHECLDDLFVNAFIPGVCSVSVVDELTKKEYEMERIANEGFYSVKISNVKPFSYKLKTLKKVWDEAGNEAELSNIIYDPYSFSYSPDLNKVMDVINGNDDILSGFKVKDLFGARYTKVDGVSGIAFCMNMPGAVRVSVVGDFNGWDSRVNQMRRIDYTDLFELFIPGDLSDTRYKFEARYNNGRIDIFSDPYAIAYEMMPGNASVLTKLTYEWSDDEYMAHRKLLDINSIPVNMYEVHMATCSLVEDLSYKSFGKKLASYMKSMNYNYVSFMPLMEYGINDNWGYETKGIFAPTSRFGKPADFMAMVDILHNNGIGVIMDMVPVMDIDCMIYWIDTYHLDGIRLDNDELVNKFYAVTGDKYKNIMVGCKWNTSIVAKLTDFLSTAPSARGGFSLNAASEFEQALSKSEIIALSHDEVAYGKGSFIEKMPGGYEDKYSDLRVFYGLNMVAPGHKLMFMGQEIGVFGGFNGVTKLDFTMLDFDANKYIQKYVKDLNKLYMTEPVLFMNKADNAIKLTDCEEDHLTVIERENGKNNEKLYIVCNFGLKDVKNCRIKVSGNGKYKELISSDNVKYGGCGNNNKTIKTAANGELIVNAPALSIAIFKLTDKK